MRILIVGGTGFLGGAAARAAVAAGHNVTVMTRSGKNVAKGAVSLIADRDQTLPDLRGQFDAVIDTCGYAPDMISRLAAAVGQVQYVFVSSISVYADMSQPQFAEDNETPAATDEQLADAAVLSPDHRSDAVAYGPAYGPLKRSCELAAQAAWGDRAALIRLGLIVGPGDYTDRFTWWVRRCDAGGVILVPGPADRLVQLIDVRDAAAFLLRLAENQAGGIFHVTGQSLPLWQMVEQVVAIAGADGQLREIPLQAFTDAGLAPWSDLPLVLPDSPEVAQMMNVCIERAVSAGLRFRSLSDTIRDTLAWDRERRDISLKCGLSPEAEARLRNF